MFPNIQIDEITKKVLDALPVDLSSIESDAKQKIKMILQATLSKLDVVSREEFDVQTQVLAKTREKVEILEKKVQEFIQKANKT
jgi:BMFP domain-containing protein YqiC